MRKVALTSAAAALALGLAGVVAIAAASQAAEPPSTHKTKTLTFDVVFSPFSPVAADVGHRHALVVRNRVGRGGPCGRTQRPHPSPIGAP